MINDLIIRSILSINMKVMTSSYHKKRKEKKKKTKSNRTIPSLTEADVYSMSYYIKLYKERRYMQRTNACTYVWMSTEYSEF